MVLRILLALLAAFVAVFAASPFTHPSLHNTEITYIWKALVKAGTDLPTPHASQFMLIGKVNLQPSHNFAHVKITDLYFKLYNGILDHAHESESDSLPVKMPDMEKVFKIIYDQDGLTTGIETNKDEKDFTRNIKKALATILQMHHSATKQTTKSSYKAFVTKEHSIYGLFDVDYTVHQHKDEIEVHKLHDMKDPHHLLQHFYTNTEGQSCDVATEHSISHIAKKIYSIGKDNQKYEVVKYMQASGGVIYQPFKAQSDHQFIYTNQSLTHIHTSNIVNEVMHVEKPHFEDDLTYHISTNQDNGALPDLTNGGHVVHYDTVIPLVKDMLHNIHTYFEENHFKTEEGHKKHFVNRLQQRLKQFSAAKLKELHHDLSGETLKVFYHILPLVGSKASSHLMKDLIVSKAVSDDVAVEMLQHFAEHVVQPTVELVTQMEDLIHMGDDFDWEVRKAALLSFAALVHKSNFKKSHSEEVYQKYVTDFVDKIKNSDDYKVKMGYTFALHNMKLHSVAQHMLPFVHNKSESYHMRIIALHTLGSSVTQDKNSSLVMETLWPIFTDEEDITEMRLVAFYFLTSNMNQFMMMNMYEYLMQEKNEEVYSFVYNFLDSVMTQGNPCYQTKKVHAAYLVKLLPPPKSGKSFMSITDFKNTEFGFGTTLSNYFVLGTHSLIWGMETMPQQFSMFHEGYSFYLKVHGIQEHGDPSQMLFNVISGQTKKYSNKNLHVEFLVGFHGQIINTYFFDKDNLHELSPILDYFTKDSQSMTKSLMEIVYHQHKVALFPTDLGLPGMWELQMPGVYNTSFHIVTHAVGTKQPGAKIFTTDVDAKFVQLMHYHQGLRFYNPFADVWQGIHRVNTFDMVLPLKFEMTYNPQQKSAQISWTKHDDDEKNVMGFRSHVKQMVYVNDDHSNGVLKKSAPKSSEYVTVSPGEKYKNEYVLMDGSSLSSGHKWYVGMYDSSIYITNGTFNHLMTQFMEPHAKNPLQQMVAFWGNFHRYAIALPNPGPHGFIIKIEPMPQVSSIDLSVRFHSEPIVDDVYFMTPKSKWSTRLTYSVKNKEKSLKTWDVNAIVDMNAGHTVNNVKMYITRIVPGQKDYKICVDGAKKWSDKDITGHMNIAMSQSHDGKCVKDDTVIDVTMKAQKSQEQIEDHHKYYACDKISPYFMPHAHTIPCLAHHTTVRHYTYNVKTTNVPEEFKNMFTYWWDMVKGYYMPFYDFDFEHTKNIGNHTVQMDVEYPMQVEEANFYVTTPQHVYKFTGVPTHTWKWLGMLPESTEFSEKLKYMYQMGFLDHCTIEYNHYYTKGGDVHWDEFVPKEWTLYVGSSTQNPGVFVKAESVLSVKIVDHDHVVEIGPTANGMEITMDGQEVPITKYHHTDWAFVHVFPQDLHSPVAVLMKESGMIVEYNGHQVVVTVPKMDKQLKGVCYEGH